MEDNFSSFFHRNICCDLSFEPSHQVGANVESQCRLSLKTKAYKYTLLSTPMGIDYVVIGFDMEVQPLVTHNAA